jgi:hypothetical protein
MTCVGHAFKWRVFGNPEKMNVRFIKAEMLLYDADRLYLVPGRLRLGRLRLGRLRL